MLVLRIEIRDKLLAIYLGDSGMTNSTSKMRTMGATMPMATIVRHCAFPSTLRHAYPAENPSRIPKFAENSTHDTS